MKHAISFKLKKNSASVSNMDVLNLEIHILLFTKKKKDIRESILSTISIFEMYYEIKFNS